ncbi:MAG: hypothetical protein IKL53_07250 [Lachnospiraceae bacterium]|nr:hypothetical protein [Lachnospiraceae bacterium]
MLNKKDLQMIFGMVQSKQCKTDMRNLVTDNIEYFENVGIEIVYGIRKLVATLRELDAEDGVIVDALVKRYDLNDSEARTFL